MQMESRTIHDYEETTGITSTMSCPEVAVVAYLNFPPSEVLAPLHRLKQAWMLFHTAKKAEIALSKRAVC